MANEKRILLTPRQTALALLAHRASLLRLAPTIEQIVAGTSIPIQEAKSVVGGFLESQMIVQRRGDRYEPTPRTAVRVRSAKDKEPIGAVVTVVPELGGGWLLTIGEDLDLKERARAIPRLPSDDLLKVEDACLKGGLPPEIIERHIYPPNYAHNPTPTRPFLELPVGGLPTREHVLAFLLSEQPEAAEVPVTLAQCAAYSQTLARVRELLEGAGAMARRFEEEVSQRTEIMHRIAAYSGTCLPGYDLPRPEEVRRRH